MASFVYESLDDAKRHAAAIERLAACARCRTEDVRFLYERTLEEMLAEARITTYLSIFCARRVERLLQLVNSWPRDGDGSMLTAA